MDLHVIFILHGYKANPEDMKKFLDIVTLSYPQAKCVLLHKCYSHGKCSLSFLADQAVEEMITNLVTIQQREQPRKIGRISFIAHSIGGLVFRLAFKHPNLSHYKPLFHFFLSLNVPHLGLLFAKYTTELGAKLIKMFTESIQMGELLLTDQKDMRQTTLYKLTADDSKEINQSQE